MEEICQREFQWSYGFLGAFVRSWESDWFSQITWKGWKNRPKVSILERLHKRVLRLAIWQHITHIYDQCFHEPSTRIYRLEGRPFTSKRSWKIQMEMV